MKRKKSILDHQIMKSMTNSEDNFEVEKIELAKTSKTTGIQVDNTFLWLQKQILLTTEVLDFLLS